MMLKDIAAENISFKIASEMISYKLLVKYLNFKSSKSRTEI